MSVSELRAKVVDHLVENSMHYLCFGNVAETVTMEQESEHFLGLIQEIKEDGFWNSDMSDLIPLCLANILKRSIRIFSSRPFTPVFDVVPDLVTPSSEEPILGSHLAIRGNDHYDAVIKKSLPIHNKKDRPQQRNTSHTDVDETSTNMNESTAKDGFRTPTKSNAIPQISPIVTPHKDAQYQSPVRKKLSRKKTPRPEKWQANIRKEKRAKGESYQNVHGKLILGREVKSKDCSNCRFKCSVKISDDQRLSIFETYWGLGSYEKQRNFICQHVDQFEPERVASSKSGRKKVTNVYSFTIGQEKIRTCKAFFLKTLDLGKKTVDYALKYKYHVVYAGKDKRGSGPTATKISDTDVQYVHDHINSFATVDSHYTRKYSKRKYLSQDLNIRRMYTLYTDKCQSTGRKPVSEKKYRDIFCNDYNLSFFHPKKDQCQICIRFEHLKSEGTLDAQTQKEYHDHQQRKQTSRQEKENDKKRAKTDPKFHVSKFDLEAVLTTPCSLVGELYYKRKLCCYNLTFYSLGTGHVQCYLWDETQGARGSCEVGSCLIRNISSLCTRTSSVKEVTYFSDTCSGQNRNQFVAMALLYCIQKIETLTCISQKFLETGHTEMECDSVHASIERAKKNTKVYVPSQWETVITLARRQKPYLVIPMKHPDFIDLKKLKADFARNMKHDKNGEKINWLKLKWIQVRKGCPFSLFVNYTFSESDFMEIKVCSDKVRGRPKIISEDNLCRKYDTKLPVSSAKKKDLLSLCASGTIPEEFHEYYKALSTNSSVKDKLPVPDIDEEEQDTDED